MHLYLDDHVSFSLNPRLEGTNPISNFDFQRFPSIPRVVSPPLHKYSYGLGN